MLKYHLLFINEVFLTILGDIARCAGFNAFYS